MQLCVSLEQALGLQRGRQKAENARRKRKRWGKRVCSRSPLAAAIESQSVFGRGCCRSRGALLTYLSHRLVHCEKIKDVNLVPALCEFSKCHSVYQRQQRKNNRRRCCIIGLRSLKWKTNTV